MFAHIEIIDYLCIAKYNLEPQPTGYKTGATTMKKTIACTTKANKTQVWHEDLQCFAAEWGLDFAWNETEAITTLTASEDEIDSLLMNESWISENFNITTIK